MHLEKLASNEAMKKAIQAFHDRGKSIVAECGGMLYLLESLTDVQGERADMAGFLPGHAAMQEKLANLGLHDIELPQGTLRGHTFHYSRMESPLEPIAWSQGKRAGRRGNRCTVKETCLLLICIYIPPPTPRPRRNCSRRHRVSEVMADAHFFWSAAINAKGAKTQRTQRNN